MATIVRDFTEHDDRVLTDPLRAFYAWASPLPPWRRSSGVWWLPGASPWPSGVLAL
jgi:hypothetical protein